MLQRLMFPFEKADLVTTILGVSVSVEYRGAYCEHYTLLTLGYIHILVTYPLQPQQDRDVVSTAYKVASG